MVKCNVPVRGWVGGVGGCPNVGGICMACTMPGFPDKYTPFMEPDRVARHYAKTARLTYGPLVKYLRDRRIRRTFDVEPEWRRRGAELTTGYHLQNGCLAGTAPRSRVEGSPRGSFSVIVLVPIRALMDVRM
jgi:hydrogenase small subunit